MSNFDTMNIGEWSEVYAFLKILSDARLNMCDENLNLLDEYVEVVSVPRFQRNSNIPIVYSLSDNNVVLILNGSPNKICSKRLLSDNADELLHSIKINTKTTFKVDSISSFLQSFGNPILKSKVASKRDISIEISDSVLNIKPTLGFSIKSSFANSSTLLNASSGTNFVYRVDISESIYQNLKGYKAKALVTQIPENKIEFDRVDSDIYYSNLQLIDTQFPQIISFILLKYFQKMGTSISDLLNILKLENPLNLRDVEIYTKKVEEFLLATTLGMVPKTLWDRRYDADGGMIVVKEDGSIATFYICRQNFLFNLMKYLRTHTFLDTPSVTRHKFGVLEKDKSGFILKLNLQIRIK